MNRISDLDICPSCHGVIGRDCWNPAECATISQDIAAQQTGYPCSPHCEGYLREQTLRRLVKQYLRLGDLIVSAAILGTDPHDMEEKRDKLRAQIDVFIA